MASAFPPTRDELAHHLTLGVSLVAATRDENMIPELVRCAAAGLGDDGLLRVVLPMPEGARTLSNVESSGAIALTAARPTTYRTMQIKGGDARRIDWPEQEAIARAHREAFVTEVVAVGFPSAFAGLLWSSLRYVAIAFTPTEIFDQTPGPSAGIAMLA